MLGCNRFGVSVVGGDGGDDPVMDRSTPGDESFDLDAGPDAADEGAGEAGDADTGARCGTDEDCREPDRRVCDRATQRCVGCTRAPDSCPPAQHCDEATRRCAEGCHADEGCAMPGRDGGAPVRRCDVARNVCVECTEDAHCGEGRLCRGNGCASSCDGGRGCAPGEECCAGACVDTRTNPAACGRCGERCVVPNASAACAAGRCRVGTCSPPYGDCDGMPENGCESNARTDVAHCGACGMACPVRPHAVASCAMGRCTFTCEAGFGDCNGREEDGCEADLGTERERCGGCATACSAPQGTAACVLGRCAVGACDRGFADCDGVAANGCEAELRAAALHCGACGRACPAASNALASCANGACVTTCVPGFADCNGREDDGCEVNTRVDGAHCSGCGRACTLPHAVGGCALGACAVASCVGTFADCNRAPADGCEADLQTSPAHCGACNRACRAGELCSGGTCQASCRAPFASCAGGCRNLGTDATHCGRCGNACPAGQSCVTGTCRLVCGAGQSDCGGRCVNVATDPAHCGRCGNACPARPNAAAVCAGGECGIACMPGTGNCNGNAADGCEVVLRSDASHCGRCGSRCAPANAVAACVQGACTVAACAPGFGDCNGRSQDGCETSLTADGRACGACARACLAGQVCASGTCRAGPDGPLEVAGAVTINVTAAAATAAAGSAQVQVSHVVGAFLPGQRVLLHQTQATTGPVGHYEFQRVASVAGTTVTLEAPLARGYRSDAEGRAQIVVVPQYTTVNVRMEGQLTAPPWNGSTGGILAFEAMDAVTVTGRISMDGRGYRGAAHGCTRRCLNGVQGESPLGLGREQRTPNGAGGGGGSQGDDCAAGGGGAHGTAGTNGSNGDCDGGAAGMTTCALACPNPGGVAGLPTGVPTLGTQLLPGSAGGEGGADQDGSFPGAGGNGGGVVFIRAARITLTGAITANGVAGANGVQSFCGTGCGQGGGGGGAGGAIRLEVTAGANLGRELVRAQGGGGGFCSCRLIDAARRAPGGQGGAGRIGVLGPAVVGTTLPVFAPL